MRRLLASLTALALLVPALAFANSRIVIENDNAPGVGFNDSTPATPEGGNPGTTVGQQRLIAFQFAAAIWGATVKTAPPITIAASFTPLPCGGDGIVLGAAAPNGEVINDPSLPFPNGYWYAAALGNSLKGQDFDPANAEIGANFNSSLGSAKCGPGSGWYYGLDGKPTDPQFEDLPVVLLHEFGHGLGFLTFVDPTVASNGALPDVFEHYALDLVTGLHWDQMNDAQRKASSTSGGKLVWDGPLVTSAASSLLEHEIDFNVTAPAGIAGQKQWGPASFGSEVQPGMTGTVALVHDTNGGTLADGGVGEPNDGCSALDAVPSGAIAAAAPSPRR